MNQKLKLSDNPGMSESMSDRDEEELIAQGSRRLLNIVLIKEVWEDDDGDSAFVVKGPTDNHAMSFVYESSHERISAKHAATSYAQIHWPTARINIEYV